MESTMSPNSLDPVLDYEAAKRELIRGTQLVHQLKATLQRSSSKGEGSVDVLMDEISLSLKRALDALNTNRDLAGPVIFTNERSPNCNSREENVHKFVTSKPFDDRHSWKKYGQKTITGFKYPRCYFKCSLRKDQGCRALKQVQQIEADPTKYQVTYISPHSCTTIVDASSPPDQCFLSFAPNTSPMNNEQVQNWPVNTNFALGVDSEMNSLASSPNLSDSDLMASFFEPSFFYDESWDA